MIYRNVQTPIEKMVKGLDEQVGVDLRNYQGFV